MSLRHITNMSLIVMLLILLSSLFFSLIIVASIAENMDDEKSKLKEVLTSRLATNYINKALKSYPASSQSFTSFLSNNIFLNIQNSTSSDLGLYKFQIGMRSHKGFKNCRGFQIQLRDKGKVISPHQYTDRSVRSHLNLKHKSTLENFFLKKMQLNEIQYKESVLQNISQDKINDHLKHYLSLAKNPNTAVRILRKLATVKNKRILRALARNTALDTETLKFLVTKLTDPYYLSLVTNHKNSDQEVFSLVAAKANFKIDLALAKNKKTPTPILSRLFEQYKQVNKPRHKWIIQALANNTRTSSNVILKIYSLKDQRYLESIAAHKNTPPHLLATLTQHKTLRVKLTALLNPNTPQAILEQQSNLLDTIVYYALAMNPATSEIILNKLVRKSRLMADKSLHSFRTLPQTTLDKNIRILHRVRSNSNRYSKRASYLYRNLMDPGISSRFKLNPSETLLLLIARHPNANQTALTAISQHSLFAFDNLLSQHENTPEHILKALYKKRAWKDHTRAFKNDKAKRQASGIFNARQLVEARHKLILLNLAKRKIFNPELRLKVQNDLIRIFQNNQKDIRKISLYPLSEIFLRKILAIKFKSKYRRSLLERDLARNPETPENILLTLAKSKLTETLNTLARRNNLSQSLQKQLLLSATDFYDPRRRKNIYSITRVFTSLAGNKSSNADTLNKISRLNINRASSALLNNPNLDNQTRKRLLSTILLRKQCFYTVAYDPNDLNFDNIVVKTKVSNADDFLVIFDIAMPNSQKDLQFAIRDDSQTQTLSTNHTASSGFVDLQTQNNVRIDTRQKVYSVLLNHSPPLVVQRNKVSYLYSILLKPVTWISGRLMTNREFDIGEQKVRLDQTSFSNYFMSRNSYIPALYFAFTLIVLILIATIYTLSKLRQQKVLLACEANKLEENIRRKAYIAELLGHEIKSPLHSLQQSLINDDKSQTLVQRINQAISKFSDLEAEISGLDGEIINFDLNQFLKDYCHYAKEYKGIDNIGFEPESYNITLSASAEDLEIVLDHIVNNANDFRNAGTEIIISATISNKIIYLSIANQGPSIPDELLDNLFDFGKSSRNAADTENLGQGLYIAREKLKELNATIQVKNTDIGVTFTIAFGE